MPSFFSKLGISSKRKNNPYLNPHHPGHRPLPQPIPKSTSRSQPSLPLRPASPREAHDLLAEARQVANRDPVTGRPLPQPTVLHQTASETNRLGPSQERSAYLNRAMQSTQTMGSRYELFAQEERRRRDEEIRLIRARGGVEYYAPERSVSEFYAGGVRD
ncbi:hypothetical protein BKA63DRAFT_421952 [Paraphoma chrysanthemicola]|nr:hypothetical protein BKA63DRAFT_421952 [Paraphoma chrysanthemicola]